jgi:hypothetical protein
LSLAAEPETQANIFCAKYKENLGKERGICQKLTSLEKERVLLLKMMQISLLKKFYI